jgi:hypothetical protein
MTELSIQVRDNEPPRIVKEAGQLRSLFTQVSGEAKNVDRSVIIDLSTENGDTLSVVVGGDETVLGFTYGTNQPPFYASRGLDTAIEPLLVAHQHFAQRVEFPRHAVIPWQDGVAAAEEFIGSGALPTCVRWQEV